MKTEREFLDGMWAKVSQQEHEQTERKAAEIRHKKIILTNTAIVLSIIAASILFIIIKPGINQAVFYIAAVLSLTAAYLLEKFISAEYKIKSESKRGEPT